MRGIEGSELLNSALAGPRLRYYQTVTAKAGVLFYRVIQNHPYVDGNKRLALTAALTFLYLNEVVVLSGAEDLETLAVGVAAGFYTREDASAFFRNRGMRLTWTPQAAVRWFRARSIGDRVAIASRLPDLALQFPVARDFAEAIGTPSSEVDQ